MVISCGCHDEGGQTSTQGYETDAQKAFYNFSSLKVVEFVRGVYHKDCFIIIIFEFSR